MPQDCQHHDGFYVNGTAKVTGFVTSIEEYNRDGVEWTVGDSWDEELTCAGCNTTGSRRDWLKWIGEMK